MLKYTICFIKQGNKILMLNREKPTWMGIWNGVDGKLNPNESSEECVIREVYEETGIILNKVTPKGVVTWAGDTYIGGMYAFIAELPHNYIYKTPRKVDEGILDWKDIVWLFDKENLGVATNIPYFLPLMLNEDTNYEHMCFYKDNKQTQFKVLRIENELVEIKSNS